MPVQWVRRTGSERDKADNCGSPHGIKQITMFIRENVECLDSSFTTTTTIKEDLRNQIELAAQIVRNKLSLNVTVRAMRKRARACIRNEGRQFESNL
ncbi:hypothetical protein J6590_013620 [Homalodisca vitripennis]|nr:hypothetical protein J6590_013620 [Homalodisca vitripennis]